MVVLLFGICLCIAVTIFVLELLKMKRLKDGLPPDDRYPLW